MKMRAIYNLLLGAAVITLLQGCIKNDIDYPQIVLSITGMQVEGQKENAVISEKDRTVTLKLEENVNLRKVHVTKLSVTEGAKSTLAPQDIIDLTNPYEVILSLYQEYRWKVIAQQDIVRIFKMANQVGLSEINPDTKVAIANVRKNTKWKELDLLELKLGPKGTTYNGKTEVPELKWTLYSNYASAQVKVQYQDFFEENWELRVYRKDKDVEMKRADGWVNVAWLYAEGIEGSDNGFEIRETTTEEWRKVDNSYITADGAAFSARIPHLKEQTTYVCRAYSGEDYSEELPFTTGIAKQLPNAKFDEWHLKGKVYNFWAEGGEEFWGSGNKGASILRSITTPDGTNTWNGQTGTSVKMESMYAVIKFAAGNLFAGYWYDFAEGSFTDGHLKFGRPFTERPTRLTGYYKYTTGPVNQMDKDSDKYDELYPLLKDKDDTCIIWVALGDWDAPIDIITAKTSSKRKMFDQNDPHVIAYGEFTQGKTINNFEPFEVELEYRDTNRVPNYILVVCSSSKYGDYFFGSDQSVMWVDDFTLEYDYND